MSHTSLSIIAAISLTAGSAVHAMDTSALTCVLGKHLAQARMTEQEFEDAINCLYEQYLPLACKSKRLKQTVEGNNNSTDVNILCSTNEKHLRGIRVAIPSHSYDDPQADYNADSNLKTLFFTPFIKPQFNDTLDNYLQCVELQKAGLLKEYAKKVKAKLENDEDPASLMVPTHQSS